MVLSKKCRVILLIMLTMGLANCQPEDTRPGLWLSGEEVTSITNDWSFTDDIDEILIETGAWYFLPHSTTIWCVEFENNLYIGSYGEELKFWEENIERNPRARLKINDMLYQVELSLVEDTQLSQQVDEVYNRKYDMQAVFGNQIPDWWFYRVTQTL